MKILDDIDKKFSDILTEEQVSDIASLTGIGRENHYFGGVQLANATKKGENIGWSTGIYKGIGVCQTKTDINNWKKIINFFKPELFFEFGVARGGNAVYMYDLMKEYSSEPVVVGFDIKDDRDGAAKENDKISFYLSDAVSKQTEDIVSSIIKLNDGKRCMFHFDDHHISDHVLNELNIYHKFLKKGDCIIVGDTWDEGWYDSPYRSLKSFLKSNSDFAVEETLHKEMEMPCNCIFGILKKIN